MKERRHAEINSINLQLKLHPLGTYSYENIIILTICARTLAWASSRHPRLDWSEYRGGAGGGRSRYQNLRWPDNLGLARPPISSLKSRIRLGAHLQGNSLDNWNIQIHTSCIFSKGVNYWHLQVPPEAHYMTERNLCHVCMYTCLF